MNCAKGSFGTLEKPLPYPAPWPPDFPSWTDGGTRQTLPRSPGFHTSSGLSRRWRRIPDQRDAGTARGFNNRLNVELGLLDLSGF